FPNSRRDFLRATGAGFGSLALAGLANSTAAADAARNPLIPRKPHFPARAKRVIFLFMRGGPSQVDSFDYKPALDKVDGQPVTKGNKNTYWKSPWAFNQYGESGMWISDLFPNVARHADDLCVINSMHTDVGNHPQAVVQMQTGSFQFARPSLGSWATYGLGTESQNLPGFITICPSPASGGAQNYGSAFLPSACHGTPILSEGQDLTDAVNLPNTASSEGVEPLSRRTLDLAQALNRERLKQDRVNRDLEGVIQSYELAFRMQTAAPEVMDLRTENPGTLAAYGIGTKETENFGRQCLLARRFAEAGVRFIQLNTGRWDNHSDLEPIHGELAKNTDQPIAALIDDLKQRGLFEDTLIVWGGEFGRPPYLNTTKGRDHDHLGFTMWMAGGGVKGGLNYGMTDEFGYKAVENRVHLHDFHATILHLLGLDHERLTYRYSGRDFRLTDVHGKVVHDLLS
ncbi:MAG: hypothetical protein ACI8UO_005778, partial [Verrucomicrobiales bacterium]